MICEKYYDPDEQSMANNKGYVMFEREYDEEGNKKSEVGHTGEE